MDYLRGYLHRLFEYAKNIEGYVEKNPVENIPRIKYNNRRTRIVSPDEYGMLLRNTDEELIKDIFCFFINTGLRLGELLSLKKSDFLQGDGFMYCRIIREKNGVVTEFPIVLNKSIKIVDKYLNRKGNEYFWLYPDGTPLKKWKMIYRFQKAKEKQSYRTLELMISAELSTPDFCLPDVMT